MGLGINTVNKTVKDLCQMAGIKLDRNKKNYQSLRATSLTRLHQAHVEEQVMNEKKFWTP